MSRLLDFTGQRFGRLTALERVYPERSGNAIWRCRCECSNITDVRSNKLRSGRTKSCGCLAADLYRERHTTHGKTSSREYEAWCRMIQRCTNSNHSAYRNYGGRGIRICPQWAVFERFFEDVGERPHGMTLDRLDNNGDYEPDNVAWRSRFDQANNKRSNRLIWICGECRTLAQWLRKLGMNRSSFDKRLRRGWSEQRALTVPPRRW